MKTLKKYRAALIALALFTITFAAFAQDPAPAAVIVPDAPPASTVTPAQGGGIVNWAQANWQGVVAAFMAVVIAARLIVKLTPTPKDDSVLEKIVNALKHVGLHIPGDDKK